MRRLPLLFALAAAAILGEDSLAAVLLVANKTDSTVTLLALPAGTVEATLPTGSGPHEVSVSPDGKLAAVSDYGRNEPGSTVTILDLETRKVARTISLGEHRRPHGLAWLPGGRLLVTAEGSKNLLLLDPIEGKLVGAIATGQEVSHMVVATEDGRRAFVANIGSGSVTVFDLVEGRKLADIPTGAGAEGIALSPDGNEVWVGNRAQDTLSVIHAKRLERLAEIPCPGFPIRLAFTPSGDRVLVSCAKSGEIAAFDRASRREMARQRLELPPADDGASRLFGDRFGNSPVPVGLVVSPEGDRAWVAATQADAIVEFDPATLRILRLLRAGREPDGMAFASGGR